MGKNALDLGSVEDDDAGDGEDRDVQSPSSIPRCFVPARRLRVELLRLILFVLGCIAVRGTGQFTKFVAKSKEHHTAENLKDLTKS